MVHAHVVNCRICQVCKFLGLTWSFTGSQEMLPEANTVLHASLWEKPVQQPAVCQLESRQTVSHCHHRQQLHKHGSEVSL